MLESKGQFHSLFFPSELLFEKNDTRTCLVAKTKGPNYVVLLLLAVVLLGLVRVRSTGDMVNDKKRVIVPFNLPVFLLSSPLTPPPLHKTLR